MKLNLIRSTPEFLNGYTNVSLFADPSNSEIVLADYCNLTVICDSAECTELRALNILDYMDRKVVQKTLDHWVSLLRHKGKIIVGGVDSYEVALAYSHYRISLEQFNEILFGVADVPWNVKKNVSSVHVMAAELANRGLSILSKRIDAFNYIVVGERQ